jgi:hypothetical protein
MSGRGNAVIPVLVLASAAAAWSPAPAGGAGDAAGAAGTRGDEQAALSAYLDRPGLRSLLADQLLARLKDAQGEARSELAERLGRVYIELMNAAPSGAERDRWEARAAELARVAPDAQSLELRIDLLKASYGRAEARAERLRLRAGDEDRAGLLRTLKELQEQFDRLANEAQRRVDGLQRAEQAGKTGERAAEQLADARRWRSTAHYFAGWSAAYAAVLDRSPSAADVALRNFAIIVNGPGQAGRPPTLDRLGKSFLKYEHVARAATGVAMALSVKGDDVGAMRWLDAIADNPEVPAAVAEQLPGRRIGVLALAKRWVEVERLVDRMRSAGTGKSPRPLEPPLARLLAVLVSEAGESVPAETRARLGQLAVQDLLARGELDQIAELVTTFEALSLDDAGFVGRYVRGMRAYELARRAHREAGLTPEQPANDAALANRWREAAGLLDEASRASDAANRPRERSAALLATGRALLLAGDPGAAAERFMRGHAEADLPEVREQLLWSALVALDAAVRGGQSQLESRLDEATQLYLREHPQGPRAAELVVRRGGRPGIDDAAALAILRGVPADSPLYDGARRQAARLMYRQFRAAPEGEREFLAGQYVPMAEELLAVERREALDPEATNETARAAAERAVLMGRQMLDVMLAVSTPDVRRAEGVLQVIELVIAHAGIPDGLVRAELEFRRLQIAIAREDTSAAASHLASLRQRGEEGARFADAGERVAYQVAVRRWRRALREGPPAAADEAARGVVAAGQAVLAQVTRTPNPKLLDDPAVIALYRTLADAATQLASGGSEEARGLAIRLDAGLVDTLPTDVDAHVRLAINWELAGSEGDARRMWARVLELAPGGSAVWFRARTESIRLLLRSDAESARAAFAQLRVLYPGFGPEPYRSRLIELERQLPPVPPAGAGGGAGAGRGGP